MIAGTNFGPSFSNISVAVDVPGASYNCPVLSVSSHSSIICSFPSTLPAGEFSARVTVGGQVSSNISGINILPPVISSISQNQGPTIGGTLIILRATNFTHLAGFFVTFTSSVTSPPATRNASDCVYIASSDIISCSTPNSPFSGPYTVAISA